MRITKFCMVLCVTVVNAAPIAYERHDREQPIINCSNERVAIVRDQNGRIVRSRAVLKAFRRARPCPATGATSGACPGYVIDHIAALKRGGRDAVCNLQWQTVEDAKAKDRIE